MVEPAPATELPESQAEEPSFLGQLRRSVSNLFVGSNATASVVEVGVEVGLEAPQAEQTAADQAVPPPEAPNVVKSVVRAVSFGLIPPDADEGSTPENWAAGQREWLAAAERASVSTTSSMPPEIDALHEKLAKTDDSAAGMLPDKVEGRVRMTGNGLELLNVDVMQG